MEFASADAFPRRQRDCFQASVQKAMSSAAAQQEHLKAGRMQG